MAGVDGNKILQGLILTGIAGLTAMTVSTNQKVVRIETILDERGNDHDDVVKLLSDVADLKERVKELEGR